MKTLSKKESQLKKSIRKHKEAQKQLKRDLAAVKRRRLAEERRALEKRNQLLGHTLVTLMPLEGLVKLKGHVGAAKGKFIHHVKGNPDDSEFQRILASLDEVIAEKQQAKDRPDATTTAPTSPCANSA